MEIPSDPRHLYPVMYSGAQVKLNIDAVEELLKTNFTDKITKNITIDDLKTAADMFFYLNSRSYLLREWFSFYSNLFNKKSAYQIILTLNRILKVDNTSRNLELKTIAAQLFQKTTDLMLLKYRKIKSFIHGLGNSSWNLEGSNGDIKGWLICRVDKNLLDNLGAVSHPVHFFTPEGKLSPSAFIPFCEFGGKKSAVSTKIDKLDTPICNCFQAKILYDQLCYEVDLNKFSNRDNIEQEIKSGFIFFMDYNEDKQITFEDNYNKEDEDSFSSRIVELDQNDHAIIHLNTIGIEFQMLKITISK